VRADGGSLADYVVGHAGTFAHAPESIPLEEAAALPVVALTAWELLTDKASVDGGEDVLVYGGSGGVGHIAVQLADAFGATVTATGSSEEKRALAAELGADATVDYTTTDVETYVDEHAGEPASTSSSIRSGTSTSRRRSRRSGLTAAS